MRSVSVTVAGAEAVSESEAVATIADRTLGRREDGKTGRREDGGRSAGRRNRRLATARCTGQGRSGFAVARFGGCAAVLAEP